MPGTPRGIFVGSGGVLGMSAEELALEKEAPADKGPVTRTKRTWWGGKKTVTVSEASSTIDSYADVEAGPEPRRPMLLAPIYNGLAAGLSLCESRWLSGQWARADRRVLRRVQSLYPTVSGRCWSRLCSTVTTSALRCAPCSRCSSACPW